MCFVLLYFCNLCILNNLCKLCPFWRLEVVFLQALWGMCWDRAPLSVAYVAKFKFSTSKTILTFSGRAILSPFGSVKSLLSLRIELRFSSYSMSTSPSNTMTVVLRMSGKKPLLSVWDSGRLCQVLNVWIPSFLRCFYLFALLCVEIRRWCIWDILCFLDLIFWALKFLDLCFFHCVEFCYNERLKQFSRYFCLWSCC